MPKVSIILPCYNVKPYLERCLESIANQKFTDWELICIDDCSSDESLNVLKMFKDDYEGNNKIIIHSFEKNQGTSVARNKGMELASGEWLCFVDPDDWIHKNFIQNLINNSEGMDIVKGFRVKDGDYRATKGLCKRINENGCYAFTHEWQSAIYRKEKFTHQFVSGLITGQDILWLTECIFKTEKLKLVENAYYMYCRRCDSSNSDIYSFDKIKSLCEVYARILDIIRASIIKEGNDSKYTLYMSRMVSLLNLQSKADCDEGVAYVLAAYEKECKKEL